MMHIRNHRHGCEGFEGSHTLLPRWTLVSVSHYDFEGFRTLELFSTSLALSGRC